MARIERICPNCGASNTTSRAQCVQCGTALTQTSRSVQTTPSLFSRGMMARLAWRATKFVARRGYALAREGAQRGMERMRAEPEADAKNETIDGDFTVSVERGVPPNDPRLRDWRVWSKQATEEPSRSKEKAEWGRRQ